MGQGLPLPSAPEDKQKPGLDRVNNMTAPAVFNRRSRLTRRKERSWGEREGGGREGGKLRRLDVLR